MINYEKFVERLKEIKKMEYVKTHRSGNTGIGKTLEDFLGIDENNIAGPDHEKFELKSARKNAKSMLTLFTKAPLPRGANSILLERFGYPSAKGNEKKELHTTIKYSKLNTLKGKSGLKLNFRNNKLQLVSEIEEVLGYWTEEVLEKVFERKYPALMYVKADSKGNDENEEFWFNEAYLLKEFDFMKFIDLLKKDVVLVDIRIGQYQNGKTHDHGTGFRVMPDKLDQCFEKREKII